VHHPLREDVPDNRDRVTMRAPRNHAGTA